MASSHDRMRWRREGVTLEGCGSSWAQHQPLTICKDGLHSVAAQAQWLSGLKALTWDMEKTWGMETLYIFITVVLTWSCASSQITKLYTGMNCVTEKPFLRTFTLAAIEGGVRERLLDDEDTREVTVAILGADQTAEGFLQPLSLKKLDTSMPGG